MVGNHFIYIYKSYGFTSFVRRLPSLLTYNSLCLNDSTRPSPPETSTGDNYSVSGSIFASLPLCRSQPRLRLSGFSGDRLGLEYVTGLKFVKDTSAKLKQASKTDHCVGLSFCNADSFLKTSFMISILSCTPIRYVSSAGKPFAPIDRTQG
nr:hypothetical protein Iba_chr10fCG11720 [Ipomoea batatas]